MPPEIQDVVRVTQAWLQTHWHVQVPFAWLEACIGWLQEEAGGAAQQPQQQINQQVLDQWLLTDLRDLDYPVLPDGLAQAQKTELSGTFCVQVDSLLDVSQPAYSQLQKWKGADCSNDEVSAVTQATQKPWEAKATRMLLLQVTDGVQSLEAMEYQSIPALSADLRPGAKLQLMGKIICRLGVLLLGPSNVKVLGGEVEDLVERNNKGRILCRTLGLPEEQQPQAEEATPAPQQGNQEMADAELDDAELLASLEAQEQIERLQVDTVQDSGYETLRENSTLSSRSPSGRSLVSTAPSRSGSTQSSRGSSVQGRRNGDQHEDPDSQIHNRYMAAEDFRDEEFEDLPLDELDGLIFQEEAPPQSENRDSNPRTIATSLSAQSGPHSFSEAQFNTNNSRTASLKRDYQGIPREASGRLPTSTLKPLENLAASKATHGLNIVRNSESECVDENMECFFEEEETFGVQTGRISGPDWPQIKQGPSEDKESFAKCSDSRLSSKSSITGAKIFPMTTEPALEGSDGRPSEQMYSSSAELSSKQDLATGSTAPALTLSSSPFTYICLLDKLMPQPPQQSTEIHIKAFIVTLMGKLSSNNGLWSVCATISDGTGYMDVELSDEVLRNLLGFSVAEKAVLKRDPMRKAELDAGMRRCQEELVDMCCVMTIVVHPGGRKAVVTKADPVNEKVLQELERRVNDWRK